MENEKRQHQRKAGTGHLHLKSPHTDQPRTVSVKDVSRSGAFVHSSNLPGPGEQISFEILDEYGLTMADGEATVIRTIGEERDGNSGFAIQFHEELEPALLDYLSAVRMEEEAL